MRKKQPKPQRIKRKNKRYSHDALVEAYQEVIENKMPLKRASRIFGVPRTTLRDRLTGRVDPDTVCSGRRPLFSCLEEARLVNHIKTMASYGYGYTRQECINLAFDLAVQLGKRSKIDNLSTKWIRGFLNRWPELRVLKPRNLEYSRARMASQDAVSAYFDNLEQCLNEHSLTDKPHLIFNLDEKGITTQHKPPYIIGSASHCPPAVTSGRGKTVTVLGCISASGVAIPPFFVFPGKRMNQRLLEGKSPGTDGSVSDSGWSNQAIFRQYITTHFTKFIPAHDNQNILLILDGHKSHAAVGLCEWARENGIVMFFLPPHTSHILQPLDVSCYGPFERMFNAECHKLMRQTEATLTIHNVCQLACRVYNRALSAENAQSAFRRTGIYPLNRNAVPAENLLPAEIYQQTDVTVNGETGDQDSQATVEGGIEGDVFQIFDTKEKQLKKIKSEKDRKQRNTMSKIISGKEVNCEIITKMKDHIGKGKENKRKQPEVKNKDKKKVKKSVVPVAEDPQPGPSCINLLSDSPSFESDTDEDEHSLCCVCKRFTPADLANTVSLTFTKWAQCDGIKNGVPCLHFVHLIYCSPVRVIRRGDRFFCPHCDQEE